MCYIQLRQRVELRFSSSLTNDVPWVLLLTSARNFSFHSLPEGSIYSLVGSGIDSKPVGGFEFDDLF